MNKEKSKVIDVVRKICPAVVSVVMSANLSKLRQNQLFSFGPHNPYAPYEPQTPGMPGAPEKDVKLKVSGGSGFFISSNGLVLTNRHVVAEMDGEYTIVTNDEKEYPAEILAKDPINDIAVLKIKAPDNQKFPCLELGDSDSLDLGQTVIAVGNVLGQFSNTVSTGIVSGLSRYITAGGMTGQTQQLRGLIQTDAAVNPGNSGGPLCDIFGRVIGINAAIVLGAQNIGFSIPVNSAKKDLKEYEKFGRIRQPFFGVRHMILNDEMQKLFNLPVSYGALVISESMPGDFAVVPNSPAAKANIAEKDIILEINSQKITEKNSLQDILQACKIGDEIALKIWRNGQTLDAKTKIEETRNL